MTEKTKKGWTRVAFGDVVERVDASGVPTDDESRNYIGLEHLDQDSLSVTRWGSAVDLVVPKTRIQKGDVLFARRNTHLRRCAVAPFDTYFSPDGYAFRSKSPALLHELLLFIVASDGFMDYAIEHSAGTHSKRVKWEDLTRYEFDLPPLEEQRRIADVMSALVSSFEAYRRLRDRLYGIECSVLGSTILDRTGVRLIPVADLLLEPPRNGTSPTVNSDRRGLRTVSISSVADGVFDPDDCIKHAEIDPASARQFLVRSGDAFVIRGNGNRQLCGKIGMSEQSYEDLFYPDLLIRLRFDAAHILPDFAVAQWNLPMVHARLISRAKSTNGIWKVNGQDIRLHTLGVPSMAKQKRVMERVATLRSGYQEARSRERSIAEILGRVTADVWGTP